MKTNLLTPIMLVLCAIVTLAFVVEDAQTDPWPVPEKYEKMENSVEADKSSINIGKTLWNQHCKSCHGKEGLGDGTKAAQLDSPCGDLSAPEFHEQSDGAILYKSWIGREEMPNYEKKIPDQEDMWHLINFIRTLAE